MKPGDRVKLSSLADGSVGRFIHKSTQRYSGLYGVKFVVTDRVPEDRSSGLTDVITEACSNLRFVWDHDDPEVEYLGTGSTEITITLDEPQVSKSEGE